MVLHVDLYNRLGVAPDASPEDIKRAYRRLSKTCHPDTKGGDATKFAQLTDAYDVLSDPERRAKYDRSGRTEGARPDDELSQIYTEIGNKMGKVLSEAAKGGVDGKNFDLIEVLVAEFEAHIAEVEPKLEMMTRTRDKYRDVAKRTISKKGKPNVLRMIADGRVNMATQQILEFERHIKVSRRAIGILQDHEYDWEEAEQINLFVNVMNYGGTTSG